MILKEFEFPERLMKIDALRRRLPNAHQIFPKVDSEYKRRLAGHWGENPYYIIWAFLTKNGIESFITFAYLIQRMDTFLKWTYFY
ncbi:hypothetical protein [Bacillus sp. FJAT-29937]|uniref:hypothetical protein n=1 Tax=Bacillus sp. FJAT-29937 TaxID=1720553 RepID=UPI0008322499|nr:hypothetical protein [Bacillus sp. FJAT-29937]